MRKRKQRQILKTASQLLSAVKSAGSQVVIFIIDHSSWSASWSVYSHQTMGYTVMEAAQSIGELGLSENGHQGLLQ